MTRPSDAALATLLLTSRLVESSAATLKASEFWALVERTEVGALLGRDEASLIAEFGDATGARVANLLDRAGALAFAIEEYEQQGIRTVTAFDTAYPPRWRERLGNRAPAAFHAAGPLEHLNRPSIAIVGWSDVGPDGAEIARAAARFAIEHDRAVVSGGPRGVDGIAMNEGIERRSATVGVLADPLVATARDVKLRRAVLDGRLCLATPYAPTAPFSAGAAAGRNKLIYALADVALVVADDLETGSPSAGAREAIERIGCDVAVWRGAGEGPGNGELVAAGGRAIGDLTELFGTEVRVEAEG